MKVIPTRIHGILDYLSVVALFALPRLLDAGQNATTLFTLVGITALIYTLLTRFELGAFKVLPMKVHLLLDMMSGLLLLAAPFFLVRGENDAVRMALIVMGVLEIGAAFLTQTHSENERTPMTRTDVSGLPRHG